MGFPRKLYPDVNRHHTIGDSIEDQRLDALKEYAGAIDIWDFTPGVWRRRGRKAVEWLEGRRVEHGERVSWYLTRSSPVSRGKVIHPLGLRGFFWQWTADQGVGVPRSCRQLPP